MMHETVTADVPSADMRTLRVDFLVALAIALFLSLGWFAHASTNLSRLILPDPDDMMRLAQVRDWIAGQGPNDWTQHRMGPPSGGPMHWSRINDFGIAAIIVTLTPLLGQYYAELTAVIAYPVLLFTLAMMLSARIGRRLWGPTAGMVAAVLTGLGYPGTTVFVPGRIDHHALQVVLIQAIVLFLMRSPSGMAGIAAGIATGLSLVVGLETVPQVAVLVSVLALMWVVRGMDERIRLGGFAAGLAGTTALCLLFLRPNYWSAQLCDAFTPASSTGTLAAGAAFAALALATPLLAGWRVRLTTGAVTGAVVLGTTLWAYPACIAGPYGKVDPFLLANFIPYIDEANGLFVQPSLPRVIAIGGAMTASCIAAVWLLWRERERWTVLLPIAAVVLASGLVVLAQARGAYIGVPLGAPLLAGLVILARQRDTWKLPAIVGAWLVSAGLTYLELPTLLLLLLHPGAKPALARVTQSCNEGDTWRNVDRYPAGRVAAGTSTAAFVIGATHHYTLGPGYHRNNSGNMAMYRFFLKRPAESLAIARQWKIDYVAFCPGDFGEIHVTKTYPNSLVSQLEAKRVPAWLTRLPVAGTPLRFYRVR